MALFILYNSVIYIVYKKHYHFSSLRSDYHVLHSQYFISIMCSLSLTITRLRSVKRYGLFYVVLFCTQNAMPAPFRASRYRWVAGRILRWRIGYLILLRRQPGRRNNITLQRNFVTTDIKYNKNNGLAVSARRVRMGQGGYTSYLYTGSTRDWENTTLNQSAAMYTSNPLRQNLGTKKASRS